MLQLWKNANYIAQNVLCQAAHCEVHKLMALGKSGDIMTNEMLTYDVVQTTHHGTQNPFFTTSSFHICGEGT